MTNAEKFKEVFGFEMNTQTDYYCPFNSTRCTNLPCDDCIDEFWSSEYNGTPTIPLSVIEKIKAEIEEAYKDRPRNYNNYQRTELYIKVMDIIDQAIKECEK